ncbi:GNAT family N-acetyltransferase, partial [bacterium]
FLHPAWHETWLRHFGEGVAPVFLACRDGDELVGVAALEIAGDTARQLGDHHVCDYAGPLALPGREAEVAAGVLEWLTEDLTSHLVLWGLQEDAAVVGAFAEAAGAWGWELEATQEAIAPAAKLPGDFETFVAGLSKKDRHELRRKLRNLEAAGEVEFESVSEPGAIEARFDLFLQMMRRSREDKDEFLTPRMEAFFRDLGRTMGAQGLARLNTLLLDGAPVAMIFCFENEGTTFLYNSGYEPALAPLAVGLLSKAHAISDAIARGKRVFDFLRGEEDYKRRLGGVEARVLTLRLAQRRD